LSQEVSSVAVLLAATLLLRFGFPGYLSGTRHMMEATMRDVPVGAHWSGTWVQEMYWRGLGGVLAALAPFLGGITLAGVAASIGQTGPYFSWGAFQSGGLKALNPVTGFKRLFSMKAVTTLFMTLAKILLIGLVIGWYWRSRWPVLARLPEMELIPVVGWVGRNVFVTVLLVVLLTIILAAIDMVTSRRRHARGMMMTKQEVKDERKQYEMPPAVKRKQFKKMRELTMARMIAEVPAATVVVTNPTRVAVALRYEPSRMDAPKVVAKGLRLRAARIRALAEAHGVPILERPSLARSLYATVPVGRDIPGSLFEAVAEVLAYLHRLGRRLESVADGDRGGGA